MKKITTLLVLFVTAFASAQFTPSVLKDIYKNDDVQALKRHLTKENKNDCVNINGNRYTLLAIAIKTDATEVFNELLNQKINIEKTCGGKTALMYTAKYGKLSMAKALVKAGAMVTAKNKKGYTAIDYAEKYKHKEIANYFYSRQ